MLPDTWTFRPSFRNSPKNSLAVPDCENIYIIRFISFWLPQLKTYFALVYRRGILLVELILSLRPSVMLNFAFILGSSKQGNARRASAGSIWVTAKYLMTRFTQFWQSRKLKKSLILSHSVFNVCWTIKTSQLIVQVRGKGNWDFIFLAANQEVCTLNGDHLTRLLFVK